MQLGRRHQPAFHRDIDTRTARVGETFGDVASDRQSNLLDLGLALGNSQQVRINTFAHYDIQRIRRGMDVLDHALRVSRHQRLG